MNDMKNNIADNLRFLRTNSRMTQEEMAERVGVTRQAVAKWENGESLPDIVNCATIAEIFEVSLNDLIYHDSKMEGMPIGPKGKHFFGTVTISERGQIVLPKKARDTMNYKPGDTLVVLGDSNPLVPGIALLSTDTFMRIAGKGSSTFFD